MNHRLKKALKITFLVLIVAVMVIVTLLKYQVSKQESLGEFLQKLFLDDLATEYLGALISILVFYIFLYSIGSSINSLINNESDSEIIALKNEISDLKEKFTTTTNSISEKLDALNHEIKIIQPKNIESILEKSRQETAFWCFSGGTGTYTKAVTLPKLSLKSRQLGKPITIELLILNPSNIEVCNLYAQLRSSVRQSDKDSSEWTTDYVRNHSYATIIICYVLSSQNKLLNIKIGLKNHFSLFRLDISSTKVLVTKEDPKDVALLFNKDSFTYESYISDFQQLLDQSRIITGFKNPNKSISITELDKIKVKEILSSLTLNDNLSEENLDEILEITKTYENPYV